MRKYMTYLICAAALGMGVAHADGSKPADSELIQQDPICPKAVSVRELLDPLFKIRGFDTHIARQQGLDSQRKLSTMIAQAPLRKTKEEIMLEKHFGAQKTPHHVCFYKNADSGIEVLINILK